MSAKDKLRLAVVGVGAFDLLGQGGEPDLLVVDPEFGEELADLLWRLLAGAASAANGRAA